MCINPVRLPNGQDVACHHCWQCVRRKIDDWTGRCIAESKTAAITRSVTLTYGRDPLYNAVDHLAAAVLTYSDVQKYLRSMRDAGYKVRYLFVGEYGAKKGRAHWHGILFFDGPKLPLRALDRNIDDEHWPHGFSFWQQVTSADAISYVTKYIAKEAVTEERQYHCGLSKMPPLGDQWFRQEAEKYVDHRLAPQDLFYSFPEVRDRKGRVKVFVMQKHSPTANNFLRAYCDAWLKKYPANEMPNSELVEEFLDSEAARGSPEEAVKVLAMERAGAMKLRDSVSKPVFSGVVNKPKDSDLRSWMDPDRVTFSERLNVWRYEFEGSQSPWYWAKDPDGVWSWRAKIGAGHASSVTGYGNAGRRSA